MFDASQNVAIEISAKLFGVSFFEVEGLINQYKKYIMKTFHDQNRKRFIPGYIWIS